MSFWDVIAMTIAAIAAALAADSGSIPLLATTSTVLFMLTGLGNGSVYTMIPAISAPSRCAAQTGRRSKTAAWPARELGWPAPS